MCVGSPELADGFPETLVLDTRHVVAQFWRAVGGTNRLPQDDFVEIVAQIVQTLLNSCWRDEEALLTLPNYERLIGGHGIETAVLQSAVRELAFEIRQRLLDIGAYTAEGCPYYLVQLLGPDVVLRLLPY